MFHVTFGGDDADGVVVLEVIEGLNPPVHDEADAAHGHPDQEGQRPFPKLCQCIVLLCPVYLELPFHIIFLHGNKLLRPNVSTHVRNLLYTHGKLGRCSIWDVMCKKPQW